MKRLPKDGRSFFIIIDNSAVINRNLEKFDDWLNLLGNGLKDLSNKELNAIIKETTDYERLLNQDPSNIEALKYLLNIISEIKNKSMEMEFRISDVQEQFRILNMYYQVEEEIQKQADSIGPNWNALIYQAKKKDFEMNDHKKSFAEITKKEVLNLKEVLRQNFEEYKAHGPGSDNITLEEGIQLLNKSKDQNKELNKKREEAVLAEKLFNLPISKFPELIEMEE